MNVAYVEMIGGVSGNMLLGAFVDAGADTAEIEKLLRTIPVDGWTLERKRVVKCGIAAQYVDFIVPGEDHHRAELGSRPQAAEPSEPTLRSGTSCRRDLSAHNAGDSPALAMRPAARRLADVLLMLERSRLGAQQKTRAREIYVRLAEAEAKAHGTTVDRIHFHEVGSTDAILDVAATCIALELLEIEELACSPFPIGRGTIHMAHGAYPNPPPATAELLRGAPTFDGGIEGEMVTTTGAAILTTLVARAGSRPPMRTTQIGYGAGRSDFAIPNLTRVSIGERLADPQTLSSAVYDDAVLTGGDVLVDEVSVLEANIDDMSPQRFELAIERALAAGAYDVWIAPVTMKKSRLAILFGALASPSREVAVARSMLTETTTLGVRVRRERRYALRRELESAQTPLGPIRIKIATIDGHIRRTLEYDDVARIARERNLPLAIVAQQLEAFLQSVSAVHERTRPGPG